MISHRPYLIRATYDWIVDNGWTPHLQVDANFPGVQVPRDYVQEGGIVLNVHPSAVMALVSDNDGISFQARFKGQEQKLFIPPGAVLAVFAKENGQGMPLPAEAYPEETPARNAATELSALEGGVKKERSEKDSTMQSHDEESEQSSAEDKTVAKKESSKGKKSHLSVVK